LHYQIQYIEAMLNFSTTNTSISFQAKPLPKNVYTGNVTIIVIAVNQFGVGEPSNTITDEICKYIIM